MNEKRERLKYVDVMRVVAMITVLVCHYTRSLEYAGVGYTVKLLPDNFFNVYLGSFGVAIFFILSGVSLMYTYQGKLDIKKYIKKRILGIYPMFWMAYIIAFMYMFYKNHGFKTTTPGSKMWLTVFGMDGYTNWFGPNFYLLGEWFLGCLILLYVLFPILKWCIDKHPIITGIVIIAIYVAGSICYNGTIPLSNFFIFRIPEFAFGMYFIRYKWEIKWPVGLVALGVMVFMWFADLTTVEPLYKNTVTGIAAFVSIYFVCRFIKWNAFYKVCENIGKYAYAVFLSHHVIIQEMSYHFTGMTFSRAEVITMFALDMVLVAIVSRFLFVVNNAIVKKINGIKFKTKAEAVAADKKENC